MTEFVNFQVDLTLKDGTTASGTINYVDSRQITLAKASQSHIPGVSVESVQIQSRSIADLKVVKLPPDYLKNGRSKGTNGSGSVTGSQSRQKNPLDSAIVFAKASTPTSRDIPDRSAGDPDWSTGSEVNDIKSSSEFDFAANLAMFDKKSVFADFQKKDTVSPGDRLVGHNKVEAARKKDKYAIDEMVLDSARKSDQWDSIGKVAEDKVTHSSTPVYKETSASLHNLRLLHSGTLAAIPLSSPVQLLEIERLSSETYGISPLIMAEVCATNLSQLITTQILGGASRLNKKNHNLPPLVVLLIGSARCGSRAFATGRHLTNHGVRVLAFVINSDDSDAELKTQRKLFEHSGGKIITSHIQEFLTVLGQLETPVELIVDALQGYDDHLDDIFYEESDQRALKSLFKWCNEPSQQNKILSLDIPSGIDGGSGTLVDESFKLSCKWIISMGLPITGLIHAYKNGFLETGEVLHYLVDVGIPNKVYSSKGNLRKFDKFWYSAESSIKLDVHSD